jgi:hypothetical protein
MATITGMSVELIGSVLGLPPGRWPPDHYTLLGLPPGETDAARVEERVLERMERLRRYQLAHPDAVTDAMNRLAQALVCLTDPAAKRAYDAALHPAPAPEPPPTRPTPPPPPEDDDNSPLPLAPPEVIAPAPVVRRPASAPPHPRRDDDRRQPYRRLAAARRLLAAWRDAGEFLGDADRTLQRPAEAVELVGVLWQLRVQLEDEGAASVGLPGQPGAVVAALARQPLPLHTFRHLLPEQRVTLASDWRFGEDRLNTAYRDLQRAVRRHRRHAARRTLARAVRWLLTDRLDLLLFVLGMAALGLALYRSR